MTSGVEFRRVVPILRIFDVQKATDFYAGFLGFTIDREHRFDDRAPLYLQVSRNGLVLHLSEHHGDGTPGSAVFVEMTGLATFHQEIHARGYGFMRPGIEEAPWNASVMEVIDPFGNRIRFSEAKG